MKPQLSALVLLAVGLLAAGCNLDSRDEESEDARIGGQETMASGRSEAGREWETKTDPIEQAFTIEMPKGWRNDVYLKRKGVVTVSIATAERMTTSAQPAICCCPN